MTGKVVIPPVINDPVALARSLFPKDVDTDVTIEKRPADRKSRGLIHEGDCLEKMRGMPDGMIRIVVTSPPYNIKNSNGNGLKNGNGGKWPKAALQGGYSNHDDCMPHTEYVRWQRECLTEMMRLLRPDGAIFYNHKWRVQRGLLQDRSDIVKGFPVRQNLTLS